MRPVPWLALAVLLQAAAPDAPRVSKVWIGHYAEYEGFLRTAAIARTIRNRAFFEAGGLASSAAVHREVASSRGPIGHKEY